MSTSLVALVLALLCTAAFGTQKRMAPPIELIDLSLPVNLSTTNTTSKAEKTPNFIIGGNDAVIATYPFMAALLVNIHGLLHFLCGGVLINSNKVLTAAHCTYYLDNSNYDHYIGLGWQDLTLGLWNPGSYKILVVEHENHPGYDANDDDNFQHDLAVLTLSRPVSFNNVVQPAKLASATAGTYAERDCFVIGWGRTESARFSPILQSGYQVAISNRLCFKLWSNLPGFRLTRREICSIFSPVSTCFGDSGGPLMCGLSVVGIAAWTEVGCSGCRPSGFTRVSAYRKWINIQKKKLPSI